MFLKPKFVYDYDGSTSYLLEANVRLELSATRDTLACYSVTTLMTPYDGSGWPLDDFRMVR